MGIEHSTENVVASCLVNMNCASQPSATATAIASCFHWDEGVRGESEGGGRIVEVTTGRDAGGPPPPSLPLSYMASRVAESIN